MGDIIVFALFVVIFLSAYLFTQKNAVQAFVITILVSLYLPTYLRFGPIQYSTLLGYICLLCCIVYFITNKRNKSDNIILSKKLLNMLMIYLLILFVWAVLSDTLFKEQQLSYLRTTLRTFAMYVFVFIYIKNKSDVTNIYRFISGFLFILTIYGLYCYVTRTNAIVSFFNLLYNPDDTALAAHMLQERGGLLGRIQGVTSITLEYAGQLLVSFFLILHYMLNVKRKITLYYVVLLLLIFINLFFTGSRSGVIGLAVGVVIWIYLYGGLSFKVKTRLTTFFVCCYLFLVYYSSAFAEYGDYVRSVIFFWEQSDTIGGSSFDMRLTQLEASINMIDNDFTSMFFGLGADWVRQYSMSHNGLHPVLLGFESIVFIGLIEFGFIGLFVVTYGFYFLLYWFVKKCHASRIVIIMIIAFVVFQSFTGNYTRQFFVCFLLVMAKGCYLEYSMKEKQLKKHK
ncbi:O-antigen ligase family protein [Bacteroides gallinaceum]|uniref:O-antigen ligase family protein n=1 Tax=Bacteroides gallinaceum TaxID=1462571 RepID=UPI0025AB3D30|nr:O-antigen ligase family protein [Bacteroides gallinaceum]MDN0065761.1 O-antigen ligase family protein [Bacteroides gallinaceum]